MSVERQDLSCTYLAHHELESNFMTTIITCQQWRFVQVVWVA